MTSEHESREPFEEPTLVELGTVGEVTLGNVGTGDDAALLAS